MCGRVVQAKDPLQVAIQCGIAVPDTRFANAPTRYTGQAHCMHIVHLCAFRLHMITCSMPDAHV
jgi:hypothetical protein